MVHVAGLALLLGPIALGAAAQLLLGRRGRSDRAVPGLMFHDIRARPRPDASYVLEGVFAEFVALLAASGRTTVTLREATARPCGGVQDRSRAVITFDDGAESFYTRALPLLSRHNLAAVVFPIVNLIGRRSSVDVFAAEPRLGRRQLREIAGLGHEVGSHTLSHPDLTMLGQADLRAELADSRAALEDITGRPVTSLSFPYGAWNRRVWEAALEAGYRSAAAYRGRTIGEPRVIPVHGTYAFDSAADILAKLDAAGRPALALAQSRLMRQFARGTSVWRFRASYRLLASR